MLGIGGAELEGVATFYNLIFRKPVGRHVIKVCDSISCFLTGYEDIKVSLEKTLGIGYGQTTTDSRFTLLPICCLGACDNGPKSGQAHDSTPAPNAHHVCSILTTKQTT